MKKLIIIGVVFISTFLLFCGVYYLYTLKNTVITEPGNNSITKDNFEFKYGYTGDNTWDYTITGSLPNPCYKYDVEGLVRESYPEQVSIVLTITSPSNNEICAQVISEVNYTGQFNASEGATVEFSVVNK